MGLPCGTKDGKVEDEGDDLSSSIESSGEQVAIRPGVSGKSRWMGGQEDLLVLGECSGVPVSYKPLRKDTDDHGGINTGIHTDRLPDAKKEMSVKFDTDLNSGRNRPCSTRTA